MKKLLFLFPVLALCLPLAASAHEHAVLHIGSDMYQFVVGSLNEPVAVDDKTGVDLTVTKGVGAMTMSADGDMDGMPKSSTAVTGLEQTLKVELISGSNKKTLDLSPAYGKPGSYTGAFYPTTVGPLSYRFLGTIDGAAIDITLDCLPKDALAKDEGKKDLGGGVMQVSAGGGFGCPAPKEEMGFPQQSASVVALQSEVGSARTYAYIAIALSALALVWGVLRRKS